MLHYYDAMDYALNAFNTPTVGYGGENDAQLQASVNIREQLTNEGFRFQQDGPYRWVTSDLRALFLVGPKTGHSWHAGEQGGVECLHQRKRWKPPITCPITSCALSPTPRDSTKPYWLTVDGLRRDLRAREVDATRSDNGKNHTVTTKNVSRLTIEGASWEPYTIDAQTLNAGANPSFEKTNGRWTVANRLGPTPLFELRRGLAAALRAKADKATAVEAASAVKRGAGGRKVHGLQGPVDDAFMDAFLCVRPTGTAWNPVAQHGPARRFDVFKRGFRQVAARQRPHQRRSRHDRQRHRRSQPDPVRRSEQQQRDGELIGRLPIRWSKTEITVERRRSAPPITFPC